jgi:hypothetical protein
MTDCEDPVVRSSRREALWVLLIWALATAYTVGYCTLYGYHRRVEDVQYIWGFPDWFFWGIVVPWVVCTVVTIAFGSWFMSDDSLGENTDFVAGEDSPDGDQGATHD